MGHVAASTNMAVDAILHVMGRERRWLGRYGLRLYLVYQPQRRMPVELHRKARCGGLDRGGDRLSVRLDRGDLHGVARYRT